MVSSKLVQEYADAVIKPSNIKNKTLEKFISDFSSKNKVHEIEEEINLLTRIINYIMKFLNRNLIFFFIYLFLAIRPAKSV